MGRTEADRQITNEPWSSMQRVKRANKTTHKSEWRVALKKDLTEPTLLEMSGNANLPGLAPNSPKWHQNQRREIAHVGYIGDLLSIRCDNHVFRVARWPVSTTAS